MRTIVEEIQLAAYTNESSSSCIKHQCSPDAWGTLAQMSQERNMRTEQKNFISIISKNISSILRDISIRNRLWRQRNDQEQESVLGDEKRRGQNKKFKKYSVAWFC